MQDIEDENERAYRASAPQRAQASPKPGGSDSRFGSNPDWPSDSGEIARLCHAACSRLAQSVAGYGEALRDARKPCFPYREQPPARRV